MLQTPHVIYQCNLSSQRFTAVLMGLSCSFLAYSGLVVPMQLSFWLTENPCNPYPTLYSDVVVDTYFMVCKMPNQSSKNAALVQCLGMPQSPRPLLRARPLRPANGPFSLVSG